MTTEDNRNGNDDIIIIELTEDLKQSRNSYQFHL